MGKTVEFSKTLLKKKNSQFSARATALSGPMLPPSFYRSTYYQEYTRNAKQFSPHLLYPIKSLEACHSLAKTLSQLHQMFCYYHPSKQGQSQKNQIFATWPDSFPLKLRLGSKPLIAPLILFQGEHVTPLGLPKPASASK